MCNSSCIYWVFRNISREEITDKRILEVGSYDVNGSPRLVISRLNPSLYVGVDIEKGPGVDIVCKCEDLVNVFGREMFDLVISTCALEHIEDWRTAISNIKGVCKVGGQIIIIIPAKWPYHGYPHDYWRFSKDNVVKIFSDCKIIKLDSDFSSGRDSEGRIAQLSLVYIKCKKINQWKLDETNLDGIEVERVIDE